MLAARQRDETEAAMRRFLAKHMAATTGTLSCFDRLLFKGHLPLGYPHAMEEFLSHRGILFKDLKGFVLKQAERLKVHAHAVAEKTGRPYEYFESPVRKDQRARAIAVRDGITEGLVCVFGTIEPCRSFRLAYGHGRPTIRPAWRKCLFLYFYFLDREFGFCHARVQTWFPFTMQVYVNGHEWLARQMDKRGLRYRRLENAFLWLEDPGRVQRLADRFAPLDWPAVLDRFAHRVNPLLRDELKGYRYYWATHQAEFATDILFTSRPALRELYVRLLRHATLCLRAEDVLTFLGRKLHGKFAGEILNDWKRRWPGARVKHWMKGNWIKMYDKHGCVLRVETVINDPYEFKVRRRAGRRGRRTLGWHPLPKGVAFLPRYATVSAAANHRYLDALAVVDDPAPAHRALDRLVQPVRDHHGRSSRPFNPATVPDLTLFAAVLRGEHTLQGFRNRELRTRLFGPTAAADHRRSGQVSRLVKRLHLRGLVAKIPRSRRWRITQLGHAVLSAAIQLREEAFPTAFLKTAA
jgi:hypothetical protein